MGTEVTGDSSRQLHVEILRICSKASDPSEMLCLQEPALYGIRTAKMQQMHKTLNQENGDPAAWFLLLFCICI